MMFLSNHEMDYKSPFTSEDCQGSFNGQICIINAICETVLFCRHLIQRIFTTINVWIKEV